MPHRPDLQPGPRPLGTGGSPRGKKLCPWRPGPLTRRSERVSASSPPPFLLRPEPKAQSPACPPKLQRRRQPAAPAFLGFRFLALVAPWRQRRRICNFCFSLSAYVKDPGWHKSNRRPGCQPPPGTSSRGRPLVTLPSRPSAFPSPLFKPTVPIVHPIARPVNPPSRVLVVWTWIDTPAGWR